MARRLHIKAAKGMAPDTDGFCVTPPQVQRQKKELSVTFGRSICGFLLLSAVAVSTMSAQAAPVIVTLNLNSLPNGLLTGPTNVSGFTLTPAGGSSDPAEIVNISGVHALQDGNVGNFNGADTILTRIGGGTFSLVSIEIAHLDSEGGYSDSFGFVVYPGSCTGAFSVGSYYGSCGTNVGNLPDYAFHFFNIAGLGLLQNVTSLILDPVAFYYSNYAVQNITLSYDDSVSAPAPGALALLGLGLIGLGATRRRKSA